MKNQPSPRRIWLARLLIAAVLVWNLQAALAFLWQPDLFAPSFELAGVPGAAAVRGIAVLFVMWNVPYFIAAWHPARQRVSLVEALIMQGLGVLGESAILFSLPGQHATLRAAIERFIAFDAAGLLLLALALWLTWNRPGPQAG